MKNLLNESIKKIQKNRRNYRRYLGVLAALALVTILSVNWGLHQNGISMTSDYLCGKEEHTHDESCYTKVLNCGLEESEGTAGHTHTDECFEEQTTLVCTQAEHTHGDECYDEEGNLICGQEEHVHSDDCYHTEKILTCGQEESEGTEGHTHTDDCYTEELTCGKEEHTHSTECLLDKTADVETAETWEATIPSSLTGDWAEDLVKVAKSQLGYTESSANFEVDADGSKTHGYTRYGAWFGKEYEDWDAMFVSFCLSYAKIPSSTVPIDYSIDSWINKLTEADLYKDTSYEPKTGDIVFVNNTVGIISSITKDKDGSIASFGMIQGDSNDKVEENFYFTTDNTLKGYAELPENPDKAKADNADNANNDADANDAKNNDAADASEETTDNTASEAKSSNGFDTFDDGEEDADDADNSIMPASEGDSNSSDPKVITTSGEITGLSGSGTTYDAANNKYTTKLAVNFKFTTSKLNSNGLSYYYDLPSGVVVPTGSNLQLDTAYNFYDGNNTYAGTYKFQKNDDGTYRIVIDLDSNYVKSAGDTITGNVTFSGELSADKADKDGKIEISGSDDTNLVIPSDQITYPDGETNYYSLTSSKKGSYSAKDGKITYTVLVTSTKGTPGDITYSDVIKATGMTLGTPTVTVTEVNFVRTYQLDGVHYYDDYGTEAGTVTVSSTYDSSTGKLSMTLPKVEKPTKSRNEAGYTTETYTQYKIVYTYDVSGLTTENPSAKNTVDVNSKDSKVEIKSKSDCTVNIVNKHTMTKGGWYDGSNNTILWTITVNSNEMDISGATLSDKMLAKIAEGQALTISPNTGYELIEDNDGNITSIKFVADETTGVNKNKYTITYRTAVTPSFDTQTVINEATFKPSSGESITDEGTATVNGGELAKTVGDATVSQDGKTSTVNWTITLTIPESGLPKGTKITDDATQGEGSHYMTRTQVLAWASGMYWADANGNKMGTSDLDIKKNEYTTIEFKASDGNTYTFDQISNNSGGKFDNLTYTVYTITLKDDISVPNGAKKLVFSYQTTANIEDAGIGATEYKNVVKVNDKSADASYTYRKAGLIKTDGNNNTGTTQSTDGTGTLTWKIKATLAEKSSKLVITDTLPVGVNLTSVKLSNTNIDISINDDGDISGDNTYYKVSGTSVENSDGTKTVTLNLEMSSAQAQAGQKLQPGDFEFVVTCKIDTTKLTDFEVGKKYTFKNSATATSDGASIGNAEQTQEWTGQDTSEKVKVVDKSGKWDNDSRQVQYKIVLNPEGKDILEGSDLLTLKDVFRYSDAVWAHKADTYTSQETKYDLDAYLIANSVKLYKAVKGEDGTWTTGEEMTNWSWTVSKEKDESVGSAEYGYYHNSTLTGTNIPDETPLILQYSYKIETTIPDGYISYNNMKISNTATLEGTSYKDSKTQDDTKWDKQDHSGEVETNKRYILYKVSKGNFGKLLAGAEFDLQYYDTSSSAYVSTGKTYTTDKNGTITIEWQKADGDYQYEYNKLYKLVEKTAPTGYLLPDDVDAQALYFYFSSDTDTTNTMPTDLPSGTIDLSTSSHTEYVENEAQDTEITINKKWLKYDGTQNTSKQGSVTVELWRNESTTEPVKTGEGTLSGSINKGTVTGEVWKTFESASYASGTQISFTISNSNIYKLAPTVYVNGTQITPTTTEYDKNGDGYTDAYDYVYSFTMGIGQNVITGFTDWDAQSFSLSNVSSVAPTNNSTKVQDYTVKASDGWTLKITGLQLTGKNSNNEKVYYSYFVKEKDSDDYTVSYDNNGGITSGTITITNKEKNPPSYELPKTGGIGIMPYVTAGMALIGGGLLYGTSLKRKRVRRRK